MHRIFGKTGGCEKAYPFVLRHINLSGEINGIVRSDAYELPVSAIREMIVNAVCHRNYLDNSCVQVAVYDNQVEVISPGMLYGGLTLEEVLSGRSKIRNRGIATIFNRMEMIEEWGIGIRIAGTGIYGNRQARELLGLAERKYNNARRI